MKYRAIVTSPRPPVRSWPAFSDEGIAEAARALRAGGVVLAPTESSYCLAASPSHAAALDAVRDIKSRSTEGAKPLLLLCASLEQALSLGTFDERAHSLAACWPAPLTLIVAPRDPALALGLGSAGLALRVPACEPARRLAERAGAFTGTSANNAGDPPLLDPREVHLLRLAQERVAGILDAGVLPGGLPSTLIDTRGESLVVLRAGAHPTATLPR